MRKIEPFAFTFILGILMILCSAAGCSDMPYTGSVLTVNEVDRYLVSTDGNVVCFQDELDSTCLRLIPETGDGTNAINGAAIHIYPEKRVYVFYHEGKPILRAVRVGDAPQNRGGNGNGNGDTGNGNGDGDGNNRGGNNNGNGNGNNRGGNNNGDGNGDNRGGNNNGDGDGNGNNRGGNNNGDGDGNGDDTGDDNGDGNGNNRGGNNNGDGDGNGDDTGDDNGDPPDGTNGDNNGDNTGDNNGDPPDGTNGDNNGDPPDNSDDGHGWIIWIYYPDDAIPQNPPTLSESGVTVTINGKQLTDEDITGFAQFIGPNNEAGIQFFYPTKSAELLDLKVQMEGISDPEGTAKFNINYLWNSN